TPLYMSPEQARGEAIDQRTDLFSLGSVLYTLCARKPPFAGDTVGAILKRVCEDEPAPLRDLNPNVPDCLCQVIAKLHAKKPCDRFASAREVADLLSAQLARLQQAELPAPTGAAEIKVSSLDGGVVKVSPARSRRRRLVTACLAVLALLLIAAC